MNHQILSYIRFSLMYVYIWPLRLSRVEHIMLSSYLWNVNISIKKIKNHLLKPKNETSPYLSYIKSLAFSHLRTCSPPPPSEMTPSFFLLYMVRNVLNRTRMWIKKISDFYLSSYHRKLGWFFRKITLKWS